MARKRAAAAEDLAYITAKVLSWAITQSGQSREGIAAKLKVGPEQIEAWEGGDAYPQFDRAQELAKVLRIPFGYLFLSDPPKRELPIPDRRTLEASYRPSPDFRQLLSDVLVKRDWYRSYAKESHAKPLAFVGSATIDETPETVAASIRRVLDLSPDDRGRGVYTWSTYLGLLATKAEQAGMLVMRSGVVGNNTTRKIAREEVQGFAIADPLSPIIYVNTSDFVAARIFTVAHELAHIWIGESAIINPEQGDEAIDAMETFCNKVATELLVPRGEFLSAWRSTAPSTRVETLVRQFWVSARVIVRRARELGELSLAEYKELRAEAIAAETPGAESSGGNYYRNAAVRAGHRFTDAVVSELNRGRILLPEASNLLDMNVHTLVTFAGMPT